MNSHLKIGLISYRSNPHCGGQGVYIRHLSHALSDLGHDVEVIAGPPDPQLNNGVKLTMLKTLDLYDPENLFRTPRPAELADPISMLEWLGVSSMGYPEPFTFGMRAKRHLKETRKTYDIIHDNQSLSWSLLSMARTMPVTATIHHPMTVDRRLAVQGAPSFYKKLQAIRWYSFISMQKSVARKIPGLITVSESSKKDIAREYKIPESRFKTIPIGIDMNHFYPIKAIKKQPGRIIVTNSADTPLKGLHHLLYAVKAITAKRRIKLVVIGSPKKKGPIEKLVKKLALESYITFTGRIDHDAFVKEYAKASIAVVPSLYEGFGLPVGEAMACRTPVISTTAGALPEVAGDAAKLVPPGNAKALELAILELLDDPAQCEALAERGYQRVLNEFTWEKCAIRTAEAYRDIIHAYH
ncbi:MAG: glycosyltransferase family 4 protein [Proteobacteria bacterium]|nr:glycosyltransferase family 4 protein [Pseudomonadota bacterium]MBU1387271.1 glycosyltransferase family 4 protein [Pseudomonadota bacterium]MBU1544252.1 glycosyltransferase family 4 protein [Pseudomonadota bacterium]MBU2430294.1 glycosyltransferase family 4 protein [Pseudomonadota bacterium]MBU2481500.1 glycosyltransferase family 4 protein [Pseudomonadota bacterium]